MSKNPLYVMFRDLIQDALILEGSGPVPEAVEHYVCQLLVDFSKTDDVFAVRDSNGRPVTSIFEMLAEADVRLNAASFDRERTVHKHIGDYILFWSGINPAFLRKIKLDDGRDLVCDYSRQGRESYRVVSTFEHSPYDREAPLFRVMSDAYDDLTQSLSRVRRHLPFYHA